MNCQIFETVVNDLAREQMMEANAREQALAHSGDCHACALRLSLERRLTFGLRALASEMKSAAASGRVEEQLLDAFRIQTSSPILTRPANRNRYWVAAAAAVVLIAFGIAGMKWGFERPSQTAVTRNDRDTTKPPIVTAHSNPVPAPSQTPPFYRPKRRQALGVSAKRSSGGKQTSAANANPGEIITAEAGNSREDEIATQFLPLSYASPVNLQDGGQLVRVELPRSAMVSFGLPVNMERNGEKVKADVLVSADGLARAIRFVQ